MIDFDKCLYDPSDKKLEEKMMKDMDEFRVDLKEDVRFRKSIFQYIVMMYDIESPLRKLHPNINHRRREAAFLAGFKTNARSNEFPEKVIRILTGEDGRVTPMIVAYLMRMGIPELVAMEASMSMYVEISEKMIAKTAAKDEMEQYRKLLKDIKNFEEEVFRGKESIDIRRALYQGMESARKAPKPEDMAKRMRSNPKDTYEEGNPYDYGTEYKVEKLKNLGDEPPV
jgi:hypothetical protein